MDPHMLKTLSDEYFNSPDLILEDTDIMELELFILREYRDILRHEIRIERVTEDPYSSHDAMFMDLLMNRRLKVYTGGTDSPILTHNYNVMFRAIHDWHHFVSFADFTLRGELRAFAHVASKLTNPTLISLMFSEIVLQAAACIHTGEFQKQRIVDSPLVHQFHNFAAC